MTGVEVFWIQRCVRSVGVFCDKANIYVDKGTDILCLCLCSDASVQAWPEVAYEERAWVSRDTRGNNGSVGVSIVIEHKHDGHSVAYIRTRVG